MTLVAFCLGPAHDGWLVLLALLFCLVGATAMAQLQDRVGAASGGCRFGWMLLASTAAGATVWCTHFVAMLAFLAGAPVVLDPKLTLVSLVLAITLTAPGVLVAESGGVGLAALGGAIIGIAVAAMHYTGMAAYHVDGLMLWDRPIIALSFVLSVVLTACATALRASGAGAGRRAGSVAVFSLAVASLHFTGMRALTIIPARLHGDGLSSESMAVLAVSTAMAGLLVIGCAAVSALIDGHTQAETFERLNRMARYDWLTGLPNRMHFCEVLGTALARRPTADGGLAVVKFNLSRFGALNDTYGTQAGDRVLGDVATRVALLLQDNEVAARMGGDKFAILKPFTTRGELDALLHRLSRALEAPLRYEQFTTVPACATGVCVAPEDGTDADALLANAELAMSRARANRSPLPCFYGPALDDDARNRRELMEHLRLAIGTDEFEMHYQVKISTVSGEVTGYEALLRWRHPVRGLVPPDVFIPLAEEVGEIVRLSDWVLRRCCEEAVRWSVPYKVAVNLSPLHLAEPRLVDTLRVTLAETGLPPNRLELELTESAIIKNRGPALALLREIKAMGIQVSLDDFGAGFSSLDVLRSFPFDRIKLDRSFMAEIETSRQAVAILRAVSTLGRWLRIPVLAEGIETEAQLAIVTREGCREVQGYLLGRPGREPLAGERLSEIAEVVSGLQGECYSLA